MFSIVQEYSKEEREMKKITFVGLLSFLILSGGALAEQAGEQKRGSSMQGMMEEMMKGRDGMGRMMQMMRMMDQCSAMMEEHHPTTNLEETKEGQKS